jgi:predicted AAA+ superfamily ATPase
MWQHILKRYYDTESNLKFVISGSASLFIKKKSVESLAGRLYEYYLDVLSFSEFLEMSKLLTSQELQDYRENCFAVKNPVSPTIKQKHYVDQNKAVLEKYFEKYIKYGQFPEMVAITDVKEINRYILENVYKKAVEYDIPKLYRVEKPDELAVLFQTIVNETGSLLEMQRLSTELAIEQRTLTNYLSYFENSYLSSMIYNYTRSFRKGSKLARKAYITSTNFFTPFHEFNDSQINSVYMGLLAEDYAYNLLKKSFLYCSFFRERGEEVDFVVTNDLLNNRGYKLFEVKYSNNPQDYKYALLKRLAEKFSGRYTVLTKSLLTETGNGGLFAPLWMFI